jgi:hypothetical protein
LTLEHGDAVTDYYDPDQIETQATRLGFTVEAEQLLLSTIAEEEYDEDLRIAEKALQTFHRSTFVREGTFKLRLSVNQSRFFDTILPRLLKAGILEEVQMRGTGYRRAVPVAKIAQALSACNGSFESFIRQAGRK